MIKFLKVYTVIDISICLATTCTIGCNNIESKNNVTISELMALQNKQQENDIEEDDIEENDRKEKNLKRLQSIIEYVNTAGGEIKGVFINDIDELCFNKYPGLELIGLNFIFDVLKEAGKKIAYLKCLTSLLNISNTETIMKIKNFFNTDVFTQKNEFCCTDSFFCIANFIENASKISPEKLDIYLLLLKNDKSATKKYTYAMFSFDSLIEEKLFLGLGKKLASQNIGVQGFDSLLRNCVPTEDERQDGTTYLDVIQYLVDIVDNEFNFKKLTNYSFEDKANSAEKNSDNELTDKGNILRMCYSTGDFGKEILHLIAISPSDYIIDELSFKKVYEQYEKFKVLKPDDKYEFLNKLSIPDLYEEKEIKKGSRGNKRIKTN